MVKVGDKVRFLNDTGGGIVRSFISKKLVSVENEDGFEIPTLIHELVVIEDETEKKVTREKSAESSGENVISPKGPGREPEKIDRSIQKKGSRTVRQTLGEGEATFVTLPEHKNKPAFYLAFVPENPSNPVGGDINAYLVNHSNFILIYHFSHWTDGGYATIKTGKTGPNSKTKLETIVQTDLANLPGYYFQLIPYMEKDNNKVAPVSKLLRINAVKFYKERSYVANLYFSANAMLLEISGNLQTSEIDKLTDQDFRELVKEKEKENESDTLKQSEPQPEIPEILEVDLHIHQLIDSIRELDQKDIIEIQMKKFFDEMDRAIRLGVKRIVFIHGIGQGTLKAEIRKELSARYRKYYFQDASFKEYGYGATMVILRK